MEKPSRKDLESLVTSQKEQLSRYETRLKDVVTAYKGLLKEKEALEASLSAFTSSKDKQNRKPDSDSSSQQTSHDATSPLSVSKEDNNSKESKEDSSHLQLQIATLMNSLATLSAEKSRMEASFQNDKKILRNELAQKDKQIKELEEKIKEQTKQHEVEIESIKSKIIIERHEREKESGNHMVMIRELQKLYTDERHLKENLEMQLNNLKTQFTNGDNSNGKLKELSAELKEARDKLKQYENQKDSFTVENSTILQQLQNEMLHLKRQHAIAIKTEQKRALLAEEQNKKLAALHEDRVANLEARLAELSNTVGSYDRLRQRDQENIQKLKDKIAELANGNNFENHDNSNTTNNERKPPNHVNVNSIVEEIMHLKALLLRENLKSENPIDVNKIFNTDHQDHSRCLEDINNLQTELDSVKIENGELKQITDVQKNHIKTLQDKVIVLNRNIDEQEIEIKMQTEKLNQIMKAEKKHWKNVIENLENEYRFKLNEVEQQLQKQRERSVQLLEEKESEIKALRTSFEIFMPSQLSTDAITSTSENQNDLDEKNSSSSIKKRNSFKNQTFCNNCSRNCSTSSIGTENCHMLHYANELARKDVEISNLRKAKHSAEAAFRQALQDKVTSQEELNDRIMHLEEQVDRLDRCKSREGANLEYLKNVILSYLSSRDSDGKKHMVNAISAVLQFTSAEMKMIDNLVHKK